MAIEDGLVLPLDEPLELLLPQPAATAAIATMAARPAAERLARFMPSPSFSSLLRVVPSGARRRLTARPVSQERH
jgi:hypothetical protein